MEQFIALQAMTFPENMAFAADEYQQRHRAVREEMRKRDIDTLLVTSPANIFYLSDYQACWYPWRLPLGLVITQDDFAFLDWAKHRDYVLTNAIYQQAVFFQYADMLPTTLAAFKQFGWQRGRVGIEWYSPNPAAPIINSVAQGLSEIGAEVVAGDWVVDRVRLFKSPAELQKIRQAARIADIAMGELQTLVRPGMTQMDVSVLLGKLLADHGSEYAATNPLVHSGPEAWRDVHAFPSAQQLLADDVVVVDCCAVIGRYHANLGRTFLLGKGNPRAAEMLSWSAGSLSVLQSHAKLGEGPETAVKAAESYVLERIPKQNVWWVGGYSLGIGFPPSWVGHTYLANDGLEQVTLDIGYVSNYENVFCDQQGGFSAQSIDTLVMTGNGLEALSTLPRTALPAGA